RRASCSSRSLRFSLSSDPMKVPITPSARAKTPMQINNSSAMPSSSRIDGELFSGEAFERSKQSQRNVTDKPGSPIKAFGDDGVATGSPIKALGDDGIFYGAASTARQACGKSFSLRILAGGDGLGKRTSSR